MSEVSICPTITANGSHDYRIQVDRVRPFAKRIHIDLMDGLFAPTKSPELGHIWWHRETIADIHLMYRHPMREMNLLVDLRPSLVIVHYEAELHHQEFVKVMHSAGIKAGLAILKDTKLESALPIAKLYNHVLVFSGHLGYHGGEADLKLTERVKKIRQTYPDKEIAWDGGINDVNAKALVESGVDVLNVGGFIQDSKDPKEAYAKLELAIKTS